MFTGFIRFGPSPVTPPNSFTTPPGRSKAADLQIQSRLNRIAADGRFVAK